MRYRPSAARRRSLVASVAVALVGTLLGTMPGTPAVSAAPKEPSRPLVEQTETADIYANTDGTNTAVFYAGPVNFFDKATNRWRKLDKAFRRTNTRIENGDGPVRVELPSEVSAADQITVRKDGSSVSFAFTEAVSKRPAKLNKGKVRYDDVAPGISLEYRMLSNGLKEDIILSQAPAANWSGRYRFRLATNGLTPVAADGGTAVSLQDGTGTEVARIPRGTMVDAKGLKGIVDMHLVKQNGEHFIDVAPDLNFVRDADRAYPLVVDPVVMYGFSSPTDAFVDSICTTCNYGGLDFLKAGWVGTAQYYAYVRFPDLTRILGKQVGYAELRLQSNYESDPSRFGLTALRTHGSWNASSITWATMASHGPERYDVDRNHQLGPGYSFPITSWAQGWSQGADGDWINGKWSPRGATINTAGDNAFYQLGSAESTFTPEIPSMTVHYTNQTPNVITTLSPADGWSGTASPPLSAVFSDPDDTEGRIEYMVDGVLRGPYTTTNGSTAPNFGLGAGTHTWQVRGLDADSIGPWTAPRELLITNQNPPLLSEGFAGPATVWDSAKWATTSNDATKVADIPASAGRLGVISSSSRATAKMNPVPDADVSFTYRFSSNTARSFLGNVQLLLID